jgi:hypothetical protein
VLQTNSAPHGQGQRETREKPEALSTTRTFACVAHTHLGRWECIHQPDYQQEGWDPQARVYVYVCVYVRVSFWTTMS